MTTRKNPFKAGVTEAQVDWAISKHSTVGRGGRARVVHVCARGHWHSSNKQASECNARARAALRNPAPEVIVSHSQGFLGPLCRTKAKDPVYNTAPTCKRCKAVIARAMAKVRAKVRDYKRAPDGHVLDGDED